MQSLRLTWKWRRIWAVSPHCIDLLVESFTSYQFHTVSLNDIVVHASEIAYVFGPSIEPSLNQTVDIALSRVVQKAWISFAAYLDPNALGNLSLGVSWPRYQVDTEQVLVFQKADGIARPVGQGLHTEKDPDDRPFCDFIIAKDAEFIR